MTEKAVARRPDKPAQSAEASASPIAAMLADPQILAHLDADKMERVLSELRAERDYAARRRFAEAFRAVQEAMTPVAKKLRGNHGNLYADIADINRMLYPLLIDHGFSWSFSHVDGAPQGQIRMQLLIRHVDGHEEPHCMNLPLDVSSAKTKTQLQAMGSTNTYGARYLLGSVFGIVFGEDNDGEEIRGTEPVSEEQLRELSDLVTKTNADVVKFCGFMRVRTLKEIPAGRMDEARSVLLDRARRMAEKAAEKARGEG